MNTDNNYAALYHHDISMDEEELEKIVASFPCSSVAHLLWLVHLKKQNDPRFGEVAKKTGIYLHNPGWIELQLLGLETESVNGFDNNSKENVVTDESDSDETIIGRQEIGTQQEDLPVAVSEEIPAISTVETATGDTKNEEFHEKSIEENGIENNDELTDQDTPDGELPVIANPEITGNFSLPTERENTEENGVELIGTKVQQEGSPNAADEEISQNLLLESEFNESQNEEFREETEEENSNQDAGELIESNAQAEESPIAADEEITESLPFENEETVDELVENTNVEAVENNELVEVPVVDEGKISEADENIPETELVEQQFEDESGTEDEEANSDKDESIPKLNIPPEERHIQSESADAEPVDEEGEDPSVPFEPLHTVDYFASQGIKLSEELLNNDQLGKQVKSFTAWLKSMKKLHPGQVPEQNEVIEKLIQSSSEESNQNANVLTEAMAEVLVKQGKREKAIEMYEKLSLINPSKSAYFAAKIESLKTI